MNRIEYLMFAQVLEDPASVADTHWTMVVDRKTGVVYSGFPTLQLPLNFQWLGDDVKDFVLDEETEAYRNKLVKKFKNWPARESI